ncbi:protein neuralized [Trichinella spiralis]|uniref:protein neuralized n=1 Tax=Trichinella spiralis TaxID=6334 RepID=UPI0001EFB525|nr:protein neuralized [Trichinella spiralis]
MRLHFSDKISHFSDAALECSTVMIRVLLSDSISSWSCFAKDEAHHRAHIVLCFCHCFIKYSSSSRRNSSPVQSMDSIIDFEAAQAYEPLAFHLIHGDNIRLSENRRVARREKSFCKTFKYEC